MAAFPGRARGEQVDPVPTRLPSYRALSPLLLELFRELTRRLDLVGELAGTAIAVPDRGGDVVDPDQDTPYECGLCDS